jgi:chromosome segregation ATPase
MALVTFESVATAAEKLVNAGDKASVRAVISELGGGSPNAVLPLLNEWKSGRPLVRASDIAINPEIFRLLAEQISTASAQSAKAAEERATEAESVAELLAAEGRALETSVEALEQELAQKNSEVMTKSRALEDLAVERDRDGQIAQDKINTLLAQIDGERARADKAVQTVAKDEVRLQAIPKLEAEVQRLAAFEQSAAVLGAKLEDAQGLIDDIKQRLATAEKATTEARAATDKANREAEQARIGEQSAQAKLESALRETESAKAQLVEAKAEVKETREEVKELRKLLEKSKAEAEAKPPKA